MPVAARERPTVRVTVDLPIGSYNHLEELVAAVNKQRDKGAPKLRYGPLMRSLVGSWMRAFNGGG